MPISDGYEACKNILNLYSDNMIFKKNKPMKNENKRNDSELIHTKDLKPVIVACTSYVDQEVISNTKKTGFNEVFLAPIGTKTIVEEIFPLIQ